MKIQKGNNQHFMTLPKWVMDNEGLRKGDIVNVSKDNKGKYILEFVKVGAD